jgi:hypothetical protein
LASDPAVAAMDQSFLFSKAYDELLAAIYKRLLKVDSFPRINVSPADGPETLRNYLQFAVDAWIWRLESIYKPGRPYRLVAGVIRSGQILAKELEQEVDPAKTAFELVLEDITKDPFSHEWSRVRQIQSLLRTNVLTVTETESKTENVKPILPGLIARLRKATEEPGKKSELAKFLDAPLASVSRWLSIDPKVQREPGGEVALKMLHWVERQECKQK